MIILSWFGGVKHRGIPAGLVAIAVVTLVAWVSTALGYQFGGMSVEGLKNSVSNFGFSIPLPAFNHVFGGFEFLGCRKSIQRSRNARDLHIGSG